ncbi:MAG TPA: hypothetical protein VGT05_00840 [Patescibacteria group bacterium]|nr:hypothetical protein [Patescibacteria group bacterium]
MTPQEDLQATSPLPAGNQEHSPAYYKTLNTPTESYKKLKETLHPLLPTETSAEFLREGNASESRQDTGSHLFNEAPPGIDMHDTANDIVAISTALTKDLSETPPQISTVRPQPQATYTRPHPRKYHLLPLSTPTTPASAVPAARNNRSWIYDDESLAQPAVQQPDTQTPTVPSQLPSAEVQENGNTNMSEQPPVLLPQPASDLQHNEQHTPTDALRSIDPLRGRLLDANAAEMVFTDEELKMYTIPLLENLRKDNNRLNDREFTTFKLAALMRKIPAIVEGETNISAEERANRLALIAYAVLRQTPYPATYMLVTSPEGNLRIETILPNYNQKRELSILDFHHTPEELRAINYADFPDSVQLVYDKLFRRNGNRGFPKIKVLPEGFASAEPRTHISEIPLSIHKQSLLNQDDRLQVVHVQTSPIHKQGHDYDTGELPFIEDQLLPASALRVAHYSDTTIPMTKAQLEQHATWSRGSSNGVPEQTTTPIKATERDHTVKHPDLRNVMEYFAKTLLYKQKRTQQETELAVRWFRKLSKHNRQSIFYHNALATLLYALGDRDGSFREQAEVMRLEQPRRIAELRNRVFGPVSTGNIAQR